MRARASGADSQNLGGQLVVKSLHRLTTPPLRGTLALPLSCTFLAERVGFEPTVSFPTHDFQSCRFGRSRTPPASRQASLSTPATLGGTSSSLVPGAAVGPYATGRRKPGQGLTAAALSGLRRVP